MTAFAYGDRFHHRGFNKYGTFLGFDEMSDPTCRTVHVQFDDGREAMAFLNLLDPISKESPVNHTPAAQIPLEIGAQVTLAGDPHPWTVRATTKHFTALTRNRFDSMGEVFDFEPLYTVLDWRNGVRGPCNLVGQGWGDGTYTQAECSALLAEFEAGDLEVSHRNRVRIEFGEVTW